MNISQADAHTYFKDIIVKNPYEDIFDEMVAFVQAKGGYTYTQASKAVETMVDSPQKDFLKYLKTKK